MKMYIYTYIWEIEKLNLTKMNVIPSAYIYLYYINMVNELFFLKFIT